MGSYNGSCMISNLHIKEGQRVVVFMLAKNNKESSLCYSNALYTPCLLPFYGDYNDYGAVENCNGTGLLPIVSAIKDNLFEYELGENKYHDIEVTAANFDIDLLFEADHEGRLAIAEYQPWDRKEYNEAATTRKEQTELDRLYLKLAKPNHMKRDLTHITIHGDIFDAIMEKYYIEEYVVENNTYNRIYFKDMIAEMPAAIELLKVQDPRYRAIRFDDNNRVLRHLQHGDNRVLFNPKEIILDYCENGRWHELQIMLEEIMIGVWIDRYLNETRKIWHKPCGAGSQSSDHLGYRILTESMTAILDKEQSKSDCEEDE